MNKRPNILFLFTDQQRFDTIAALGNPVIKTPALDRLVCEGTAFTRAYTPSPVCISGRCSLITGLPAHVTDCIDNVPMPQNLSSFMELLNGGGYQTHGVGKMHFSPDPLRKWGFESRDVIEEVWDENGGNDYCAWLREHGYSYVIEEGGMRSEYYYIPQPSQFPAEAHQSSWVADRSIDFLNRRDKSRPFMLWSSWIKPHPPFESPAPWSKLYRPEEVGHPYRPEDGAEFLTLWNKIQNRYKWRDAGIDENLMRTMRAAYLGCISFIDYNIGRVLAALGDEIDNTLIIFASDHGELLGDYNSVGKRCMIDASVRIPLIVRWPKNFNAGAQCDTPVSLLDIRPTFLAAAGITDDHSGVHGSDLATIAAGEEKDRAVVSQFQKKDLGLYMLATRDRKYVYSAADRKELLLDISGDALSAEEKIMDALAETAAFRKQLTGILENDGIEYASGNGGWKEYPAPDLGLDDPDCGLLYQDSARGGEVLQERINELPEDYRRKVYKTGEDAIQLILGTINLTK